MRYSPALCAFFIVSASLPAHAADSQPPAPSAYQNVMRAQYAARAEPQPARPEEAQRIYDAYLSSIGRPTKEQASTTNDLSATSPH